MFVISNQFAGVARSSKRRIAIRRGEADNPRVIRSLCASVLLAVLCLPTAQAGEIYRYHTADGRTVFTDIPPRPAGGASTRDRALEDVRYAESELLQAYDRLTAGAPAHADELMPVVDDGSTKPRRGRRKIPRSPEYYARIDALVADIDAAQKRLDEARERFYALN